ncbi:MAG: hypothetical protein Q4F83_10510 [Eubacteriales bacterium]|nr:hypothetical protein [Eubacteriales bacterium]
MALYSPLWDTISPKQKNRLTLERTKEGIITTTPKTFSSNRTVTMPADVIAMLHKHRAEQKRLRLALGTAWKGDPASADTLINLFQKKA